jgi:hypothetical protein
MINNLRKMFCIKEMRLFASGKSKWLEKLCSSVVITILLGF